VYHHRSCHHVRLSSFLFFSCLLYGAATAATSLRPTLRNEESRSDRERIGDTVLPKERRGRGRRVICRRISAAPPSAPLTGDIIVSCNFLFVCVLYTPPLFFFFLD
jgi:hypothetical protein